jgi:predicted nucleic acid-binding protein
MSDRYFLDTNIFIYSFDNGAPEKVRRADQLIRQAVDTHKGVVSYQVVQEFFNVALRRFQQPMTAAVAERYMGTVFRPLLRVQSSLALYLDALRIRDKNRIAWYDALIVAGAIQAECEVLYTEDLQHGQRFGGLRVVNPFL